MEEQTTRGAGAPADQLPEGERPVNARSAAKQWLARETASVGTWDWNLLTGELSWSERCKAIFGLAPDTAMTHERFLGAIHPEDRAHVDEAVKSALASRTGYEVEMRVCWPDGSVHWVAAKGRGFYERGVTVGMAGMAVDVTVARHAEQALREQLELEDQLARIAASVPGVICSYLLRPDGTACMPFSTPAAEDIYGVSQAELAKDFAALAVHIHPDDRERVDAVIAEAARTASRWHDIFRYLHPSKGLRWLEGWSAPRRQPDGSILWHGYVMDVTERERALEAVRDSDRRKGEFLAMLSHELRNPLAPIRNSLYLLERAAPGSEQAAHAREVIERQTRHLARLVDDLLDVNRISRGKVELHRAPVELGELVRRTCEDHRASFEQRAVEVRITVPARPAWVDADATRVAQIVGNLLQNAAKFTREGGRVEVSVDRAEAATEAEIRVRDDGVGLAPDFLTRAFEPFVQADSGLARTKGGLGLGLALVKGLTELHGGSVRALSEGPGRGATFVVTLPLCPAPAEPAPADGTVARERSLEILLVEDNLDAAETLAQVLELLGHRVRVAHDGQSGLAAARAGAPDVVLCDIGLPDLDGYQVARTLRQDPALRSVRLVALSGYAQPEDRERALTAGFDDHLGKPVPLEQLSGLLADLARRPG